MIHVMGFDGRILMFWIWLKLCGWRWGLILPTYPNDHI